MLTENSHNVNCMKRQNTHHPRGRSHVELLLRATLDSGFILELHTASSASMQCVWTPLCFCKDLKRNDGTTPKPFLMSPGLKTILGRAEQSPRNSCG
ncbi:choline transporter-like protein 5-A [Onychostoma macrolepis]|uniref:choline transporter-like protein 5-A n=1 Tax=Onychostoma macrolepis TaxID=369639 RepID=UPI00272ABF54|nr:choline transporter-like protein 5-A [Onychostoma macrolepis]